MYFRILCPEPEMKNRIYKYLTLLAISVSVILSGFMIDKVIAARKQQSYETLSYFRLSTPEYTMPATVRFQAEDGKGILIIIGQVYRDGHNVGTVNRRLTFDMVDGCFCSQIHISSLIKYKRDNIADEIEKEILPPLFYADEDTIHFKIKRVENGMFFMRDNMPMFFARFI